MSMIGLNKLVFDPANMADSANVGAYLRGSDGTLITQTGGALDVNIVGGVNVEVDLSHVDDSVKIGDGTDLLAVNNDGSINAVVSATDLDIRNLAFATDKVDVGGSVIALDSATLAALESITVSATDLDIRYLTHVSDSVKVGDGTDLLAVNADGSINTKPAGASSAAYGATSVTTTVTDIVGTDLTNRIQILIQNLGAKDCYIGSNNSVTTSNGVLLAPGSSLVFDAGAGINIHGITASGSTSIRYFELAA